MRESLAAHDRELGYYTSFTLCRGGTLYPQVMLPICHRVVRAPYTSTKETRQGNTMRPLQRSTSLRKPATISRKSNAEIPRLTAIAAKSTREPPYMPTPLAPFWVR
jgi:hypothetical protein